MADLFSTRTPRQGKAAARYSAKDIEVLEGLEPVRRHPGMYIGGTDEAAMHHLAAELLDNAMDEVLMGEASRIEITLEPGNWLTVRDNGRGIPVDPHPRFKGRSALEVVLTTLHSGGKFSAKVYETSGGLHGVGLSVVNALADSLVVEVARERGLWSQSFQRGKPRGKLKRAGTAQNRRGTTIRIHPDPEIFGPEARFQPARVYRMARAKAHLHRGVEIAWKADPSLVGPKDATPANAVLHFPGGLADLLAEMLGDRSSLTPAPFAGEAKLANGAAAGGRVEWALTWPMDGDGELHSYCNTIPTPQGGTHESGLRAGLMRAVKAYGELTGNRKVAQVTADDVMEGAVGALSVFVRDPQFQGQTKERLASPQVTRMVEATIKDHFDHWLAGDPATADRLVAALIERAEERAARRRARDQTRKSATRKLRLPGKLADCSEAGAVGTEVFLVEGDSAGGSAKQARDRRIQAVLPLRGKILNVATATTEKLHGNQEINDLIQALGCGTGPRFEIDKLRYERVIIMTDADVDGAHIASLLITFFYREMPGLIDAGRLYLAAPPLYRLGQGGLTLYARDDAHKDELLATAFKGRGKVEISRFKGLGEMPPAQLRETTMDPARRTLLRVTIPEGARRATAERVESLMGRKPELRLRFIQEHAAEVAEPDI
ncbi:MAG TPA: DNA topoisomerase IV subunit B [Alphaproteobacteria bacterium]